MTDFMGKYSHKVDAKGRVALPPKFGKLLAQDLVVTLNPEGTCLFIFEPEDFNEWVKSFFEKDGGFVQSNPRHVKTRSVLKGRAKEVSVDSAGRIMLAADQREAVAIDKDALFIGNDGYVEIWNPENRAAFESEVDLADLLYGIAE